MDQQLNKISQAEEAVGFLTRIGSVLDASLDTRTLLQSLPSLVVPTLADVCTIHLVDDDGRLRSTEAISADPRREAAFRSLDDAYPIPAGATGHPIVQVIRTGQAQFVTDVPDSLVESLAVDECHLELLRSLAIQSFIIVPLAGATGILGALSAMGGSGRRFTRVESVLIEALALRAGPAIETARWMEAEHVARQCAEVHAGRVSRLQLVTEALGRAMTIDEVVGVSVSHGLAALDADAGTLVMPGTSGTELVLRGSVGYPEELVRAFAPISTRAGNPLADAYLAGTAIWLPSNSAWQARYPHLEETRRQSPYSAAAAIPLAANEHVLGALGLSFLKPREFSDADREMAITVARQCGQALERARLIEAERAARMRAEEQARDLQRSQEEAAQRAATLDAVLESIPDGIYVGTPDGIIQSNRLGLALLGARSLADLRVGFDELAERLDVRDARSRRRVPVDELPIARALRGEVVKTEMLLRRLDTGQDIPLRVTNAPIVRDGRIVGAVGILSDITQSLRAEEELRQALKMEAVGRLAGGVAHEVNNQLTVVIAVAHYLAKAMSPDDDRASDIEEIRRAAEHSADVTRQLLAFSRRQMLRPQLLDVNAVITSLRPSLDQLLGEAIRLECALTSANGAIRVDRTGFDQILVNLAINAREAMPSGGRLYIETADVEVLEGFVEHQSGATITPGPYTRIAVTDTGIGMPPDVLAHAFEPFFTTKRVGQGPGLGLATVYGIVKQSQGYIWASSEPGHGTCCTVYLPRVSTEASQDGSHAAAPEPYGGSETILLVEDEASVRTAVHRGLQLLGFRILEASSGQAALEAMQQHAGPIDLVLCDVVMPAMGGRELERELARTHPGVPVLFMSGFAAEEVVDRGLLDPGRDFISKPFTPDALAQKIRETLDALPRAAPRG